MNLIFSLLLNSFLATPMLFSEPEHYSVQGTEVRRDALDDKLIAFASLSGAEGQLLVGCDFRASGNLQVILETKLELARDANLLLLDTWYDAELNSFGSSSKIQIRFDNGEAYRERWNSSRRRAVISPSKRLAFVKSLNKSEQLVMRFTDIEDREITLAFDTSEVSKVIVPIVSLCEGEASRGTDG